MNSADTHTLVLGNHTDWISLPQLIDDTGIFVLQLFARLPIPCLPSNIPTFGDVLLLARVESELDVFSFHLCTSTKHSNEDGEKGIMLTISVKDAQLFFLKKHGQTMAKIGI